jgi:hypothetical protein
VIGVCYLAYLVENTQTPIVERIEAREGAIFYRSSLTKKGKAKASEPGRNLQKKTSKRRIWPKSFPANSLNTSVKNLKSFPQSGV